MEKKLNPISVLQSKEKMRSKSQAICGHQVFVFMSTKFFLYILMEYVIAVKIHADFDYSSEQ